MYINNNFIYAHEKNYPEKFLEECKYVKEKIKANNYIDVELKSESDSESDIDIDNDIDIDIDIEE